MAAVGADLTIEASGGAMMGPTEMEQITTPAEQAPMEAQAETYSPPPAARSARSARGAPRAESRERRWWTIALAATLLVSAIGVGMLYADDTGNQASIRSLTTQNESLTGRNQILHRVDRIVLELRLEGRHNLLRIRRVVQPDIQNAHFAAVRGEILEHMQ